MADVVVSAPHAPAGRGIKLMLVMTPPGDIETFLREHFSVDGQYNYSRTRWAHPQMDYSNPDSVLPYLNLRELAAGVFYIPLTAPLYARSERLRGPFWAELYDLGALRGVWLER